MTILLLAALTLTVQDVGFADWHVLTTRDGLPENDIRTVYEDGQGVMWFGTRNAGVVRLDGSAWTQYTQADGLVSNGVLDLVQTADGVLWAVGGRGYSRFENERWAATHAIGPHTPNVVYDVFETPRSKVVWLGFNGGAARYDGADWTVVTPADGLPHAVVHGVLEDLGGTVWFACRRGLARLEGERWTVFHPDENFRSIVAAPDGTLWFGTSTGGALEWADGAWTQHLPGQNVHPVLFDRAGVLWAKSDDAGVFAYDGDRWRHFSTANGFPSDTVHGIGLASDGTLWFATSVGAVWGRVN